MGCVALAPESVLSLAREGLNSHSRSWALAWPLAKEGETMGQSAAAVGRKRRPRLLDGQRSRVGGSGGTAGRHSGWRRTPTVDGAKGQRRRVRAVEVEAAMGVEPIQEVEVARASRSTRGEPSSCGRAARARRARAMPHMPDEATSGACRAPTEIGRAHV